MMQQIQDTLGIERLFILPENEQGREWAAFCPQTLGDDGSGAAAPAVAGDDDTDTDAKAKKLKTSLRLASVIRKERRYDSEKNVLVNPGRLKLQNWIFLLFYRKEKKAELKRKSHPAAKGVRQKEFGKRVTKKVTEAPEKVTKK